MYRLAEEIIVLRILCRRLFYWFKNKTDSKNKPINKNG